MSTSYLPPEGWRYPTIEEIVLPAKGAVRIGPFGSALKKDEYSDAGVRVLGIEDVLPNRLVSTKKKFIPERKFRELTQYLVTPGDVLVTNMGTVGRTCVVPAGIEKSIISSHLIKMSLNQRVAYPEYVSWMLNYCPLVVRQIEMKCHGAIMAGFNSSLLKQLHLPLPCVAEQRRIAAILDQAEAVRTKRRQALAKLDTLTQSLFLEMFGDPESNSLGWPTAKLSELVTFRTGKLDSNAAVPDGPYPFFTCSREDFRIDKYAFDCEALLLAGNNAVGDYSVKHYRGKFNAYQRTYVITLSQNRATYGYLKAALEHKLRYLKRVSKGTGTRYLTLEILNNLVFQTPPIELQRDFGTNLEKIEGSRTSFTSAESALDRLFFALQHRAFRGEL